MNPKIMLPAWASSRFVFYSLLSALYVFIDARPGRADMQFSARPNASVTYVIQVQIGAGNDAKRYPGRLTYVVKSAAPDLIQLSAFGSIEGVYRSYSLFDRNTSMLPTLGRVSISSTVIGIDPRGNVKVSQRDESLEMLLGTLGQLGIAPLPPPDAKMVGPKGAPNATWATSNVINVQQTRTSFGMSPEFARRAGLDNSKLAIANESWNHTLAETKDGLAKITHAYQLNSEHSDPPIKMLGDGTAIFNVKTGFYDSLEVNRVLFLSRNGAEFKVPVSISLVRQTDEEKQVEAAAKEKAEAEKARPFTDQERQEWLAALAPEGSDVQATQALVQLAQRKPRLEPGLASALLERADRKGDRGATLFYQQAAQYDPRLKNVAEDRADYARGDFLVRRTGGPITAPTRLQPGQLIAVSREPFSGFEAAEFVSVDSGGMVSYRAVNGREIKTKPVTSMRLAPDTVIQPRTSSPPKVTATRRPTVPRAAPMVPAVGAQEPLNANDGVPLDSEGELRTWSDKTGKYKIEASFIELRNETVRLRGANGKQIEVPLASLSAEDAKLAIELSEQDANPFQVIKE